MRSLPEPRPCSGTMPGDSSRRPPQSRMRGWLRRRLPGFHSARVKCVPISMQPSVCVSSLGRKISAPWHAAQWPLEAPRTALYGGSHHPSRKTRTAVLSRTAPRQSAFHEACMGADSGRAPAPAGRRLRPGAGSGSENAKGRALIGRGPRPWLRRRRAPPAGARRPSAPPCRGCA